MMRQAMFGVFGAVIVGSWAVGCGGGRSTTYVAAPVTTSSTAATQSSTPGSTPGGSTAPTASPTLASGALQVLTYNVAGLPQGLSSSSPVTNTPQISPLLNNYELVLAQEDFWYHVDLEKHAQHPHQSLPLAQFSTLVNDGLNRFSQTPFTDHTRQKWTTCHGYVNASNDCLASKGFSVARHELAPGVTVDVYNLHADAGGSAGDEQARLLQFAQLSTFMAAFSRDRAVIVGGDTNLSGSRPADALVLNDFLGAANLTEVTRLLNLPDRIDRFLFRNSLDLELDPTRYRVADEFVDLAGQPLSDHPAIHVEFSWRQLR